MAGAPVRDPVGDHLLTPQNSALVVIDYQPSQFAGVRSMDRELLGENIVSTVQTAKAFDMPIVHSTINVATGRGQPTVPELAELLENNPPIDRTTTNAWEDAEFLGGVWPMPARTVTVEPGTDEGSSRVRPKCVWPRPLLLIGLGVGSVHVSRARHSPWGNQRPSAAS